MRRKKCNCMARKIVFDPNTGAEEKDQSFTCTPMYMPSHKYKHDPDMLMMIKGSLHYQEYT